MRKPLAGAVLVLVLLTLATSSAAAAPTEVTDAWIAGYAAAVLERERGRPPVSLRVRDGVIGIGAEDLAGTDRARVVEELRAIRGVRAVEIHDEPGPVPTEVVPAPADDPYRLGLMPGGQLFTPLIADPRWPHFGASFQRYIRDRDFRNIGAVSLGESFMLYRGRLGPVWWEIGAQAGVFSIFDLDADSRDLLNTDFLVTLPISARIGDVSAMVRLLHQSSHLGDEFLLRPDAPRRVGLSYEAVDLRLSWEPGPLRLYAGGGHLYRTSPRDLERWMVQYGVEFRSPWPGPDSRWRPVAGVDVQQHEKTDWHLDLSFRGGLQVDGVLFSRNLQLLLEYYRGHSPHGQFFVDRIEYVGLGLHFNF